MAMIKKLSIQGVRSFSPADSKGQMIEFGSPLTLILGVNGSGKTTIIETLKYAITSQFPPNSAKGASFVNDPKLSFNDHSLAKILLELTDAQGNTFITTRKVKATVKNYKGDLSMSQLEGTLRVRNAKGETHQLTNKCSDVKFEMARLMGVSEAVLNHVIFCHQEESCWPLDEGKKVKETFDAIFNTTAYKKCFDRMGVVDKELQTKIKVEVEGLKWVTENRQLAKKYQDDLTDKNIKQQQQSDHIKEYERDIKVMEDKLREFQSLEADFAKKQSEVAEKRTKIEALGKHIAELRSNIKEEFAGSRSELQECINKFKDDCSNKRTQAKEHQVQYKQKDAEWNRLNEKKSGLLKEEGMLQQEENANEKRLGELNAQLVDIVSSMKKLKSEVAEEVMSTSFSSYLEACDSQPGSLSYDTVHKILISAIRMKESELQKVKEEFDKEESELQSAIDDVRSKMAAMDTEKNMKRQQLASSREIQEKIKNRLKALEGSNETLRLLDDDEENYINQIETIEKSGFMVKCDSEIKALAVELKSLESNISTMSENVNVLVADKSIMDQISMLNRQKLQKENECNQIMRKMEDDLSRILENIPEVNLVEAVDSKVKSLNSEIKVHKQNLNEKERALTTAKSDLKHVTADLKKFETKLKGGKSKIMDVLEEGEYEAVHQQVTQELEKLQSDCSYAESASYLYKKYLGKLSRSSCCPLCKRDFETEQLLQALRSQIETDVTRMTQNVPKLKQDLDNLKARQQSIMKLKPIWDECKQLETDTIPESKTKKAELEEKIEQLDDETMELSATLAEIENTVATARKCSSSAAVYEQCRKELKKTEDQIVKYEKSRNPEAKSCNMTLADAQTELQELQRSMKNKRCEKENKEDTRNKKRDELSKLQQKKNKVKEDKLLITAELQNREALETQKKELETETKNLQAKINEITQALPTLKAEIGKAEKNKSSCVKKREVALKKLREDKDGLEKQKYGVTELHKRILDFEKKRGKLAEVQQCVAACNDKLSSCEQQKKDIEGQIDKLKKDLTSQELRQRELNDNLSLKAKLEEVSKLKVELKEKETILAQAESRGPATEKRELGLKHQTLSTKLNVLKGSTLELKKSIRDLEKELAIPHFANAEMEYIEKVAKKCVYEKALRDVRRYKTALDTAIMQFHHKKMEKINKVLMDYWRRIYKGNDIDKIMIKTEADKDPAGEPKAKKVKVTIGTVRKNYNYRVVMVRRGVDIDMRGRCSAGQRVLASIIIRIALAESFGARCGIITLDEPTTNLDQKNIDSLADALSDLAEKMSSRRNFQLIVITHDQDFTSRLSAIDAVEHYWKVDRDKEGFSQISIVRKRGYNDD